MSKNPPPNAPRTLEIIAEQNQGLPGQFLAAYSPKTQKIYIAGTFNAASHRGSCVATIARVDPQTLAIEATAQLPVIDEAHPNLIGEYQLCGAFGLSIDDTRGTIWVTDPTTSSVAVYDRDTFAPIWSSYQPDVSLEQQPVNHPREVLVLEDIGKAVVTGPGGYWFIDTGTYAITAHNPVPGSLPHTLTVTRDTLGGNIYLSDYNLDKVYEVSPAIGEAVRTINVPAGETSDFSRVNTHGVAINSSLNEIYVSTQGENGKNSGVQVLDKISGSFKQFIPYGITPTDIIADETRDLVYLTDFGPTSVHPADSGGGTVAVIDARTKSVVAEVHIASGKANHLTLLPDGTVIALDKAGTHKNIEVGFHIDPVTGKHVNSAIDVHASGTTPINADSITKITVALNNAG